jgi:Kdo2-lipid IVA lauroyltransferase/acyltransferase
VARKKAWKKRRRRWRLRVRSWTRPLRYGLFHGAFAGIVWVTGRVSHARAVALGGRVGRALGKLAKKERETIRRNLDRAFGSGLSAAERSEIEEGVFESLGMLAFEAAHAAGWTAGDFEAKIDYEGEEHWRAALAGGRGALFVTGHLGNWELMPPGFLCHAGVAVAVIARDIKDPVLNRRIEVLRGRMGNRIFSSDQSGVGLMRVLRKGGVVSMLADQDTDRVRCVTVPFFGRPARTPVGPAYLSRRTGAPIVPVYIRRRREDRTRHLIRFYPPIHPDPAMGEEEDAARMTAETNACLEAEIREAPEQWAWIHDRWKSAEAANSDGAFAPKSNKEA